MKVLLAPDKFKGSLTAAQVAFHLGSGLAERGIQFRSLPLADGGDGSVQAAIHAGFEAIPLSVTGPTGLPRNADIAYDGRTCVVEVADTCGLAALPRGTLAPLTSSSRGLGEAICEAVRRGAGRIVLALGGSSSTDGGAGMLAALGMKFYDLTGNIVEPNGGTLHSIHVADPAELVDLSGVEIIVASDVQNVLTGANGAAAVYGPQKGASSADIAVLDAGLTHFVDRLAAAGFRSAAELGATPGAGSAGGIGFAGLVLGATLVSGADFFLDLLGYESQIEDCDLVITGEGRMDGQTLEGKLPAIVARRSGTIPVIAVVGRSEISSEDLQAMGIDAVFALSDRTTGNPATDPGLSAQLLTDLGRTLPLERIIDTHAHRLVLRG
jgi:glycerate 2-kinase